MRCVMNRAARRRLLPLVALAIAGCAVGPDFHRPAAPAADHYLPEAPPPSAPAAPAGQAAAAAPPRLVPGAELSGEWWQLFHSPVLRQAVEAALADSPTLAAATATLAEAEQQV